MNSYKLLIDQIARLFGKEEGLDDLLKMSEHWDGYKRENAVRRLGMLGNPIAIPYLIVRANDWVSEVRVASREAITKLMKPENVQAFILSLPSLYHLRKCGRDNHDELIQSIEKFVATVDKGSALKLEITNDDGFVARYAFLLALNTNLLSAEEAVGLGIKHNDLIVRYRASYLIRNLNQEDKMKAIETAIKDKFMPIRREALQLYLQSNPEKNYVANFLFDRHASVREITIRFLISTNYPVAQVLSESLNDSSAQNLKCAIWGLGYLNYKEVLPLIYELSKSKHPSVRKQALQSLAILEGEKFFSNLVGFLLDSSPAVVKEASRLINKHGVTLTAESLLEIVRVGKYEHTVNACFILLRRINKWESLIFIISILTLEGGIAGVVAERIKRATEIWNWDFNRSHAQPSKDQLKRLAELYADHHLALKKHGLNSILFTLDTLGVNDSQIGAG